MTYVPYIDPLIPLLKERLDNPSPPQQPQLDSESLHDCKLRSAWLTTTFPIFATIYYKNPTRFLAILTELNYTCPSCSPRWPTQPASPTKPTQRPQPLAQRTSLAQRTQLHAHALTTTTSKQRSKIQPPVRNQHNVVHSAHNTHNMYSADNVYKEQQALLCSLVPTTPENFRAAIQILKYSHDRKALSLTLQVATLTIKMEICQQNGGPVSGFVVLRHTPSMSATKHTNSVEQVEQQADCSFANDDTPALQFHRSASAPPLSILNHIGTAYSSRSTLSALIKTSLGDLIAPDIFLTCLSKWLHKLYFGPENIDADAYFAEFLPSNAPWCAIKL